ncbi:MAG: flagellar biosynthesis protein FlhB, partial [Rhizobiales bacterium]|nr:flagellar biosynthesis protein FlhB [Hyphomicrobiales bacterium]
NDDDGERTEEPSTKKLEDALKRGDVAKSQEVTTWFMLAGATLVLFTFASQTMGDMARMLGRIFEHAHQMPVNGASLIALTDQLGTALGAAIALPALVMMVAAIAGNLVQHQPVLSLDPMTPKLSKISPIAGFKRLFSTTSLVNFAKGLAKLAIVGTAILIALWPEVGRLFDLQTAGPESLMPVARLLSLRVFGASIAALAIVAALDYAYQRHKWFEKQRMSVKELRDEYKQMEGDPAVRAKLRQIRIERGRKRMMAQIPNATVLITNPTHYAIALKYEPGMAAPVCLAKGTDLVALRIRKVAEESHIPVVENPPLARALHATVEIDDEIPVEHYRAVAEIIGFVMRQRSMVGQAVGS